MYKVRKYLLVRIVVSIVVNKETNVRYMNKYVWYLKEFENLLSFYRFDQFTRYEVGRKIFFYDSRIDFYILSPILFFCWKSLKLIYEMWLKKARKIL